MTTENLQKERRINNIYPLGQQIREALERHFESGYGFKSGSLPVLASGWDESGRFVHVLPLNRKEQSTHIGDLTIKLEDMPRFSNLGAMRAHLTTLTLEVYGWMNESKPN